MQNTNPESNMKGSLVKNAIVRCTEKGTTLFEVLLYIALFTILSSATIYLYISILKTTDALGLTLQKIEIQIYTRQLAEYQLDTSRTIDIQTLKIGMERIIKWYPNFSLVDVGVEYTAEGAHSIVRLAYQLEQNSKKKTFSYTIYLSDF